MTYDNHTVGYPTFLFWNILNTLSLYKQNINWYSINWTFILKYFTVITTFYRLEKILNLFAKRAYNQCGTKQNVPKYFNLWNTCKYIFHSGKQFRIRENSRKNDFIA